jgi:DNA-binding transcriptional MerR regulator
MENELVTISEMAKLHHLTRQTLIYYDHIGLLKPVYINEHGYRFYSVYQIPVLREICLLKKLGVKLDDIKKSIEVRNPDSVINMLELQKKLIDEQIQELNQTRMYLQQRINFYDDFHEKHPTNTPIIKQIPPRKILFVPFLSEPSKNILHLTLMKAWNQLLDYNTMPSSGFGTLIRQAQFEGEDLYKDSGIFVVLPHLQYDIPGIEEIPGGTFACMYKYSFPYYEKDFRSLKEWIDRENYKITGDALDLCLLDTTFYNSEHNVDYCCLQIPVSKN